MNAIATVQQSPDVNQLLAKVSDQRLSFAARVNSVGDVMRAMSRQMMAALPKHLTPDRMIRVALNGIRKNPKLLDCSAASLFGAITEAATYGWEIGGFNGHAYLVPYKDECVLIPGYKGMIDLCRRSGQNSTISMEVVHQGDDFRYSLGDDPHIHHQPNDNDPQRDAKPITHVYAVVKLRDGGIQRSVWSAAKIDAHKEQYSQSWKRAEQSYNGRPPKRDSFWHTAWPAAAKKTVIRDMINRGLLPVSAEYRDTIQRGLQNDDDGDSFGTLDIVPGMDALEGDVQESPDEGFERPQTADEVDSGLVERFRKTLEGCNDADAITSEVQALQALGDVSEATWKALDGVVETRRAELDAPKGKGGKRQGELVK